MTSPNDLSEKYLKYLTGITFEGQSFFTIHGMDTTLPKGEYDERILVDNEGKMLLFSSVDALFKAINTEDFFDNDMLRTWAKEFSPVAEVYAVIDLDAFTGNIHGLPKLEWVVEVYHARNFMVDYEATTGDQKIIDFLADENVREFYDVGSNYLIWGSGEIPVLVYDMDEVMPVFQEMYEYLKTERIVIRD